MPFYTFPSLLDDGRVQILHMACSQEAFARLAALTIKDVDARVQRDDCPNKDIYLQVKSLIGLNFLEDTIAARSAAEALRTAARSAGVLVGR